MKSQFETPETAGLYTRTDPASQSVTHVCVNGHLKCPFLRETVITVYSTPTTVFNFYEKSVLSA